MTSTITVRGRKIRSRSNRRYIAVAIRPEDVPAPGWESGVYAAFATIIRRSDSIGPVRKAASDYGFHHGAYAVVVDTTTGEEV